MKKLMKVERSLYDQKLYANLLEPEEAAKITMVSAPRLIELSNSGYAPAIWIDGRGPFFKALEIMKWTKENLVRLQAPMPLRLDLKVIVAEPADPADVPFSISQMSGILKHYPWREAASSVYFLVEGGEVVYVGQSTSLAKRIETHTMSKAFDQVFYIPVPPDVLTSVESALIRALRPKLNETCRSKPSEADLRLIETYCKPRIETAMETA